MSIMSVTSVQNKIQITSFSEKISKLETKIKEKLNSVKTYILSHKSKLAQIAGAAGIAAGIFALAATSITPLGAPLIAIGSIVFLAGTAGLIIKKVKEGQENQLKDSAIAKNILKETIKNTFIGIAVADLAITLIPGTATLPILAYLKKNSGGDSIITGLKEEMNMADGFYNKLDIKHQLNELKQTPNEDHNVEKSIQEPGKPDTPKTNQNIEKKD